MEDETGLLPIKENDMKYYVYVSTPIALVGGLCIRRKETLDNVRMGGSNSCMKNHKSPT